jgi:hypothetical protein
MIIATGASTYLYGRTTYTVADLYTITATVGTLILTTWPSVLLSGTPAVIRRGSFRMTLSSEISSVDITIGQGSLTFGGLNLPRSAARGDFDAGTFLLERILDPGGANIRVPRFKGYVQRVEPGASELRLVAEDFRSGMNRQVPGRAVQPMCPYKFGPAPSPCGAATAGPCLKTAASCTSNLNFARFGGFPYVARGQ